MFTGIVEEVGVVTAIADLGDAVRLSVRGPAVTADAALGDSIAVNGCCLTVAERPAEQATEAFAADVMRESLDRTSLGALEVGDSVNLERAALVGNRLGGHLVQGHVDGTGTLQERTRSEHWDLVRVSFEAGLARYVASKGSIAVDGVSLTVVDVADGIDPSFTVSLVPATLEATTLGEKQPGDRVNLEVDIVAKYVERLMR